MTNAWQIAIINEKVYTLTVNKNFGSAAHPNFTIQSPAPILSHAYI
jgi:hypothetical protein